MKNKKKIITETVTDLSPYDFATSLANLHAKVGQWIQQYGPNASLDWDANFHYSYDPNPSPRFNLRVERAETDKERETRIAGEVAAQEARDAREREEFVRLQKKFGE